MSIIDKTVLKSKFQTGDKPTQLDFEDFIDSTLGVVQEDDGTITPKLNIRAHNEGATVGDTRGDNSVDLQTAKTNSAYVAAAPYSVILGGQNNGITADGNHSVVGGRGNHTNSCKYSLITGNTNTLNSGNFSTISGYRNIGNFGNFCNISGEIYNGVTKVVANATATNSNSYITSVGHGFITNDPIRFTAVGTSGLTANTQQYYVTYFDNDNFTVKTSIGGGVVDIVADSISDIQYITKACNYGSHCSISGYNNYGNTGSYSSITGNNNCKNSGSYGIISGQSNCNNSGTHCTISGDYNYNNTGNYCNISGRLAKDNNLSYAIILGGNDNARSIDLVAKTTTTTATPTELTLGGVGGALIVIPSDTTWGYTISVVARRQDAAGESAFFKFTGCIDNNAGTVADVGSIIKEIIAKDTLAWDVDVTADNVGKSLLITATGEAGKTIIWVAKVDITQAADE